MANPLSFPSLVSFVARLADRVAALERRRAAPVPANLDDLDDVQIAYNHSASAPADGHVLTWVAGSSRFGGLWQALPSVAGDIAASEALASYDDSDVFDELSYYLFQPQFVVAANSYQLVIVTAYVDGISDTTLPVTGTGLPGDAAVDTPTPWKSEAYDATGDPGALLIVGGMGSGAGRVSFPLWLHNATDDEATHTVAITTGAVVAGYEFDATVTVRAESVFQMAAIP